MKKLITLLLLFPLFISCSKEDDKDNYISSDIIYGNWYKYKKDQIYILSFGKDGVKSYFTTNYSQYPPGLYHETKFRLTENSIILDKPGGWITSSFYKINGDSLHFSDSPWNKPFETFIKKSYN